MSDEPYIGIDLGTTYSAIAYIDAAGAPVVEKNAEDEDTTPSVILFDDNKKWIVGKIAKDQAGMYEANRFFTTVKRQMGTNEKYQVDDDIFTPIELSSCIVSKLLNDFAEKHGTRPTKAVITCPAYFGTAERMATRQAGEAAGLKVVKVINEPTAAAISYGFAEDSEKKTILVYDLGGGTFDVTILEIDGNNYTALSTEGDKYLGGKDWDKCMSDLIVEQISEAQGVDPSEIEDDPNALQQLIFISENSKKTLSIKDSVKGTLQVGPTKGIFSVTREEFEAATKGLVDKTLDFVDLALTNKKMTMDQIDAIVLVGGSSKMPAIEAAVKERYPNANVEKYEPDYAVTKGAAIYAKSHIDDRDEIIPVDDDPIVTIGSDRNGTGSATKNPKGGIVNILSKTFGLIVTVNSGNQMISNLLFRNERLPMSCTKTYDLAEDGQTDVLLQIYESTANKPDNEKKSLIDPMEGVEVGQFDIELPPNLRVDSDKPRVTFSANSEGVLTAILECGGVIKDFQLKAECLLLEEEIEQTKVKMTSLMSNE